MKHVARIVVVTAALAVMGAGTYLAYAHSAPTARPVSSLAALSDTPTAVLTPTLSATTQPTAPPTQAPTAIPTVSLPTATSVPSPTAVPVATPTATSIPTPTPTPCQFVNCNPWGFNFASGNTIQEPPLNFCDYFRCDANFWNGTGYVSECQDGYYEKRYGRPFSCAGHGGDLRLLYGP